MSKIQVPTASFSTELTPGSIKGAMKTAGGNEKSGLWLVPVGAIRRIPDFNVRVITEDYEAHKDDIAKSIFANGFYPDKPLSGYIAKGEGDEDSVIMLTDGYTRLGAVELAIERGAEIERIPVIVKPQTDNLIDLTVALLQGNEGRPLTPYEKAIIVKRLLGYNMPEPEIAARLGMTERYVSDLKVLIGAPVRVRDMVIRGKVSSTEAIKQLRKDPKKAVDRLVAAVETATASGKSRATAKHVDDGEGGDSESVTSETKVKGGKAKTKFVFRLKGGEKIRKGAIEQILQVAEGSWWREPEDLDDAKEGEVIVTETITISLLIERAAPEEAEGETDSGDAGLTEGEVDEALQGAGEETETEVGDQEAEAEETEAEETEAEQPEVEAEAEL